MTSLTETPVVTCFLRNRGEVLLLRRSGRVGSYQGKWGAVAGYVEGEVERSAWREIEEETALTHGVTLAARGEPFTVDDEELERRWIVHPFLFDSETRDVRLDWESTDYEWLSPGEILRRDTVPQLWASYRRVAPSLETVRGDRTHGAAYLSFRAVEVLRDRAAELMAEGTEEKEAWGELKGLARQLLEARPTMVVLENRVSRVMHDAGSASGVEAAAREAIREAYRQDDDAASNAARLVAGRKVLTLSRSGTVVEALQSAKPPPSVVVAESRPGSEGVEVASELAARGLDVTLVPDAALAEVLEGLGVEIVLVGADAVLASGAIVNKVGTHLAALAASARAVPFYACAGSDKITTREKVVLEMAGRDDVFEKSDHVQGRAVLFEVTPPALLSGIVTERGVLEAGVIEALARELSRGGALDS